MAPPRTLHQAELDGVCSSHLMFERMIQQAMEGLGGQIERLADAVTEQNKANNELLAQLLKDQAGRRELCGQQNARLDSLERNAAADKQDNAESHRELWSATNKLRFYVFVGVGLVVAINAVLGLYIKLIMH